MKTRKKDFVQVPHEFLDVANKKLDPEEQLIFIHLSRFCYDSKNTAFPSQTTLARLTGYCEKTINRKIKSMVKKGVLVIVNRSTNGKAKLNTYKLMDWYDIGKIADKAYGLKVPLEEHTDSQSDSYGLKVPFHTDSQSYEEYEVRRGIEEDEFSSDDECGLRPQEPEETDALKKKEYRENIVPPVWQFDDRNKPLDLDDCSGLTLEQAQHKIYFYFKNAHPTSVHKHKAMLYRITDLELLRQAAAYLPYWPDMQYGDGSLCMFITNLEQFLGNAETRWFRLKAAWEEDNRDLLVDRTIRENNLFDIRDRAIIKKLPAKVQVAHQVQANWIETVGKEIYFRCGNLALGSLWGEIIRPDEFHLISDQWIRRILREDNGVAV